MALRNVTLCHMSQALVMLKAAEEVSCTLLLQAARVHEGCASFMQSTGINIQHRVEDERKRPRRDCSSAEVDHLSGPHAHFHLWASSTLPSQARI